jgi:antitoxin component of MazEF toxin-antitoxin module
VIVGRIRKVGNSLVVAVPKDEAETLELSEGDLVIMDIRKAKVRLVLLPDLQRVDEESWERNEAAYSIRSRQKPIA